jgi:hypothetical protein
VAGCIDRSQQQDQGATTILTWLLSHPGEGWQQRWVTAGADTDLGWIDTLVVRDTRSANTKRQEHISGLACLLMCRVVVPSDDFLTGQLVEPPV